MNLQVPLEEVKVEGRTEDEDEDEDIEFEDVEIPKPTVQTTYLSSSEDESEEEDLQFEDVDIEAIASKTIETDKDKGTEALQLNLTAAQQALTPSRRNRKPPLTKAEKERRVEIHRLHLLCLLAHVEKRNHWCNDQVVQKNLRRLVPAKTVQFLNPPSNITQFGQTESIRKGLKEAEQIFQEKFRITERGLRRALWAEDTKDLQAYEPPSDIDNCLDKDDFRRASRTLRGSRDVGAMLFCALLRAVGVEARLVCSLQPLSFATGGPTLPKPRRVPAASPATVRIDPPSHEPTAEPPTTSRQSIRSRLGHPHAAAYRVPDVPPRAASTSQQRAATPRITESPYPVYWTEVLDVGHQKWQPVDAIVTGMHFRPNKLEPPASDRENTLTYVVAFEEDGAAKDVTRRYAKAYNSKTRRLRVDGPLIPASAGGKAWWYKALKRYKAPGSLSTLDQIENAELNAAESREPMPRNVSDFKDHPIYALERHLRRHEVLVPCAKVVGTIAAGNKGALEKIYRRRDVRLARSAEKWFRMGRYVEPGTEPVKVLPKRKFAKRKQRWHRGDTPESSDDDDPVLGPDPAKGTCLYMYEQTELYVPRPVIAGMVPKNKFGNIEVYVPTMVPAGGVHVKHARARHAAHILGVDYAPALQGFEFKGRTGTAVYNGVVIPVYAEEGVMAVLQGFEDLEAQMEEERRSRRALATWQKWLRTLTIRRRLFEGDDYWGGTELGEVEMPDGVDEEDSADEDDDEPRGGGFMVDDDDGMGGGFEPDADSAGGFEPAHDRSNASGAGGFEPGGFEPGGFEPGGFEPGGFEPEGFEPGGFEPGGFESGGFERIDSEPVELKTADPTLQAAPPQSFGTDGQKDGDDESFRLEHREDIESGQAGLAPGSEDEIEEAASSKLVDIEPKTEVTQEPAADIKPPSKELGGVDESEDAELEDAASDVTEYMYMDDDGNLLE